MSSDGSPGAEKLIRRWIGPALWFLAFLPVLSIGYTVLVNGLGANPIRELEHLTGQWALRFLAGSLAVSPLIRITGWGSLIRERRFLGLTAFVWASIHLSAYIGLDMFFNVPDMIEDIVKHPYVTIGMLTFLLLIPLALTSTRASIRRLGGQKWQQLHRLVYVAAITATVHYLWAVKKDTLVPILYFGIFATLLGTRFVWSRARSRTPSRNATK